MTLVVFFIFAQSNSLAQANPLTCSLLLDESVIQVEESTELAELEPLTNPPKEVMHFLNAVAESESKKDTTPKFIDPAEERELQKRWVGTKEAPLGVTNTFHENASLLDFQLLASDAGVVKSAAPGDFVSMRWNETWRGKNMSTNIGVNASAVVANAFEHQNGEPVKTLMPSQVKGVFIFLHGGGTKTTGHHVANTISNYLASYGIAVVSLDAPYHGYGPRPDSLSPTEYYEYLKDFRYQIASPDTPVFIGGHSMGGVHADNIMRMSDDPSLGFYEAFKGLIALSSPLDSAPGESLEAKAAASDLVTSNEELMSLVPEAERDLMITLLLAGKSSSLGGISAETFVTQQNWVQPEHNGSEWIPTLHVMGQYDALYIGREQIFDDYVTALDNTDVVLMGDRLDHNGHEVRISHMIFDHRKPVDAENNNPEIPETFAAVKDFIESQLGQTLGKSPIFQGSTHGLMVNVIREYYNNLAFRIFAKNFKLLIKESTPLISELGQRSGEIGKDLKALKTELAQKKKAGENTEELQVSISELEAEMAEIRGFQRLTHIPTDDPELETFARENVTQREEIDKKIQPLFNQRKDTEKQLRQAQEQRRKLEKALAGRAHSILYKEGDDENVEVVDQTLQQGLEESIASLNASIDKMVKILEKVNEENSALIKEEMENGTYRVRPPQELIEKYKDLDEAYGEYISIETQAKSLIESMIATGQFGEESQNVVLSLWGDAEALKSRNPTDSSLVATERALRQRFSELSVATSNLEFLRDQLTADYINRVAVDYYSARFTTFEEELNRPLQDLVGQTSHIEKLWRVWTEIWKSRPPESETSLY